MRPFYIYFIYILYIFRTLASPRATRVFEFYRVQNVQTKGTKCAKIKTIYILSFNKKCVIIKTINGGVFMTSEVVKYHNDLNTVVMRTWTAEEMNFFFTILTKAKEQGLKKLVFDTDELKLLASSSRKYRWEETITTAVKKIGQLTYFEQSERKFRVMTLFEIFEVDLEKRTIEVKVSANFDYILNKLETQFTRYELEEFTSIRSTYAKTMYRLLKQWRTLGQKEFSVEDLKRILDTPKAYRPSEIDRLVLKPILSQLSPYFQNLKVKKIKSNKRGTPVLGYEFTWIPEKSESYDPNKFNKPKQKQKNKSNVPTWSNADYVNTTSEETKAELESKKQEMLSRLDNSEVQTDIYDYLD